jgi:acyl-CoA thioesterase-1
MNKILLMTMIILTASCSQAKQPIPKDATIIAFGDSLTYGFGAAPESAYPKVLSDITGYEIINEGMNGDTARNGVQRIKTIVQKYNPSVVIIGIGGNDIIRRQSQNLEKDLNTIVSYLKSKNIQPILLSEPQPTILGNIITVSDSPIYERVANKQDVVLLDNIYSKYLADQKYKSDLIHLNDNGYNRVAEDIAQRLKKEGLFQY